MDVVANAKVILGITDSTKDSLLEVLKDIVSQEFMDYCHLETIPTSANACLLSMLLYKYNQLGAEGVASQSYSGISESYIEGYADNIIKQMNRFRKVISL